MEEKCEIADNVQLVAFFLENEEFAAEIGQVREVMKVVNITPLPRSFNYIEGVINLRGEIIPVVDLRKRFGLPTEERDNSSRIIIVELVDDDIGLIVDSVTEVIRISRDSIQPPPDNVAGARTDLIKGVGKINDRLIIILNLEKILLTNEQITLDDITLSEKE